MNNAANKTYILVETEYGPLRVERGGSLPSPAMARVAALVERVTEGADSPCQDMQYTSAQALRAEWWVAILALVQETQTAERDRCIQMMHNAAEEARANEKDSIDITGIDRSGSWSGSR